MIWSKKLNSQAKTNVFSQLILLSNNLELTSYLSGIYLESWFSSLSGGVQKTLKKRRKQTEEKHWKSEEKEIRRVRGKSNNNKIHLWFYLLYKKLHFDQKHKNIIWKKVVYTFTSSNFIYSVYALQDIWNTVMIHQSSIYIYIQIIIGGWGKGEGGDVRQKWDVIGRKEAGG